LAFKPVGFARRVEFTLDRYFRRACLTVPAHKLCQITSADVSKALNELFNSGGLAVMAREIKIHAGAKFFGAEQRLHHSYNLGAFLVYGSCVEIIDFLVRLRSH